VSSQSVKSNLSYSRGSPRFAEFTKGNSGAAYFSIKLSERYAASKDLLEEERLSFA